MHLTSIGKAALACTPVLVSALLLFAWNAGAAAPDVVMSPGYRTLSSSLPAQRFMVHMGVWYPSRKKASLLKIDGKNIAGAKNAPILPGPWPVIILSHDTPGNAWAHHATASMLAARGYIVAAPTHDHDNSEDMGLLFSDRELPTRALQVRAALDIVLEHPMIGPQADASRVGFLGFGSPASAGFLLAGGTPTPDEWPGFCAKAGTPATSPDAPPPYATEGEASPSNSEKNENVPSGTEIFPTGEGPSSPNGIALPAENSAAQGKSSPWCGPYLHEHMDALTQAMRRRTDERVEKGAMRNSAVEARAKIFRRMADLTARSHQRLARQAKLQDVPAPPFMLPLLPPLAGDNPVDDGRFKALAMVSPGYSMLFSSDSLSDVTVPVLCIGAGRDKWNAPALQAERFARMLGGRCEYALLPQADEATFLAGQSDQDSSSLLGELQGSCPPGQKQELQARLNAMLLEFFGRTLAGTR